MSRGIKGIKEIVKYSRSKESVDEEDYGYPKEGISFKILNLREL